MLTRTRWWSVSLTLAVVLTACGDEAGPGADSSIPSGATPRLPELEAALSPCDLVDGMTPWGDAFDDPIPLVWRPELSARLLRVDGRDLAKVVLPEPQTLTSPVGSASRPFYELTPGEDISGTMVKGEITDTVRLFEEYLPLLENSEGRVVLVTLDVAGYVKLGVLVDPAGAVVFSSYCVDELGYNDEFAAFRDAHPEFTDALATVEGFFTVGSPVNEAYVAWERQAPEPVPTWEERDPRDRVIDPEVTPVEVYSQLVGVQVEFVVDEVPDEYRLATVCTFVPEIGWGDCAMLPGPDDPPLPPLPVLGLPGSSIEVWLLNDGLIDRPLLQLTDITPERWEPAATERTVVVYPIEFISAQP
jgi:hypothetical protein